uniref:HAT C-terminal dimerisation domain-containing protein n=1 Tax=Latimeria chalumnae TaxID=7897 RepID=H2ZUZ1_LATCH
ALRGHDERQEATNRGNFLELCDLLARYDEVFAKKLSGSFSLTGHVTQNKLSEIAADIVKSNIIEKVQENVFFTILVDEARSFKQEQMTVCVRYTENLEIKERFLGFVDCFKRGDADAIYQNIKQFLELSGIANIPIVAQCYDGVAVMAGHINEVQQKILQDYPTECNCRFSSQSMKVAKSVDAVLKCDSEGINELLSKYGSTLPINPKLSYTEMELIKIDFLKKEITPESLKGAASTKFYPDFTKLLKLALTSPVGTATCVRSFSAMQRIHNWLRSTMGQERTWALCLLHIESDIARDIN